MSLDVTLTQSEEVDFDANITHNLGLMADVAGIYHHLWRPEEIGVTKAEELIQPLKLGLALMQQDPAKFEALNASNGWRLYEHFLPWVERYLAACEKFPDAEVRVDR